ncbi:hypothetical protein [Consotaella aegiceratis]|uniref:hypothetical protein n=1 Tax=Consotaella aegiceratis TaxID=3097961 RepID=UPI002F3F951F
MSDFLSEAAARNLALSVGVALVIFAVRMAAEWLAGRSADPILKRRRNFLIRAITNGLLAVCLPGLRIQITEWMM